MEVGTLPALKRIYRKSRDDERHELWIGDVEVTLDARAYQILQDLDARRAGAKTKTDDALDATKVAGLATSGLTLPKVDADRFTGDEFHNQYFAPALGRWLLEAFDHPFWDRMGAGEGSSRLFTGWLFELYHFTRNANRHMPLAAAMAGDKALRSELSKHYAEEWDHFSYFSQALQALGFSEEEIAASDPLPTTAAMANFMRQAARTDVLAYAACSAVLEGTTLDEKSYEEYYRDVSRMYDIPQAAVQPLLDHVELDKKYGHRSLFLEICERVPEINTERGNRILSFGHQMVEHIQAWTSNIETYYGDASTALPRRPFDIYQD